MKDNMKQLLNALCNFDVDIQVNGIYGKLEKFGEDCYWVKPKRGEGFALEGEMLEHLELCGAVSLCSLN